MSMIAHLWFRSTFVGRGLYDCWESEPAGAAAPLMMKKIDNNFKVVCSILYAIYAAYIIIKPEHH